MRLPRPSSSNPATSAPVHEVGRPRQAAQLGGDLRLLDVELLGVPVARPQPVEPTGEVGEQRGIRHDRRPVATPDTLGHRVSPTRPTAVTRQYS